MTARSGLPPVPPSPDDGKTSPGGEDVRTGGGWAPHDLPSAAELLDAVREFLEGDVVPSVEGRLRFHARVAANVVAMVGRELALGPQQEAAHGARLARLGVRDEAELAEAIRSGTLEARMDEVRAVVSATVRAKLAVAHPGYSPGREPDEP